MNTPQPVQLCYVYPDHEVLGHCIGTATSAGEAIALAERTGFSPAGEVEEQRRSREKKGRAAKAGKVFVVKVTPEGLALQQVVTGLQMQHARENLDLSQKQLGDVLGVSERTIQRWEANRPHKTAARAMEWMLRGYRPAEFPRSPYMASPKKRKETAA